MFKPREELEKNLIEAMLSSKLKTKRKDVEFIKNELRKYKILNVQEWVNDPENEIPKLEPMELFLLTEQVHTLTKNHDIVPEDYFTEQERKKSRQYTGTYELTEEITFPLTLENMSRISYKEYSGLIPADLVAKLSMSRKLHYNFNIQRESVKRKVKGVIVREPKVVMQNVLEIANHLENNSLKPSQIVYNAALGTADDNQPELIYDEKERRLTISRGVILDVLDGHHRTKGTEMAFYKKGHLDFQFTLLLTNYSEDECRTYQGQHAKQTPIAQERAEEFLGERMADEVLKEFLPKSELKERVSDNRYVHTISKELTSYRLLAESIEEQFTLEKMVDVYKVSGYLTKIFNYLLGVYEEEFTTKYDEYRESSLINNSNMVGLGYIVLARRLMENKRDPQDIIGIIGDIDFSRNNQLWERIGVMKSGKLNDTVKLREAIKTYFEKLDI